MTDDSTTRPARAGFFRRVFESDLWHRFVRSPTALMATVVGLAIIGSALLAPWISPHDPFGSVDLMDGRLPPAWVVGGNPSYLLGTDDQGRDILSLTLWGMRLSLFVGVAAVALAAGIGITFGLVAGFFGGLVDMAIMRLADIQLSFPNILVALLIDGILRTALSRSLHDELVLYVLVAAIGISNWVQYARTVRASTLVERRREYVQAARVMQIPTRRILVRHILPNILGPVIVISTLGLAVAIISEATLSFLGVGLPPTEPSLGTLIRTGNEYLFSGEWWITLFPALALVLLALSVNIVGDWLRDALNPRLR
jgi:peptide/nickel transport system permease protein